MALLPTDQASALDCAKAATPQEKAICGDPALKDQDAALSRFYFDTLRGLQGERHDLLIADQRRWLVEQRGQACKSDKGTSSGLVPCLTDSLAARRRTIAICFAGLGAGAAELAGKPVAAADLCSVYLHSGCPRTSIVVSARLLGYAWLLQPLVATAKKNRDDFDCGPKDAQGRDAADQNESDLSVKILAERPNLVSVRIEQDDVDRGAAHPNHGEQIVSYDTRTRTKIPIAALMPKLKPDSPVLARISEAANLKLDVPCCGEEGRRTFGDIGLADEPTPDGWTVASDGSLILAYEYNALGRLFVATAKIPRALFIAAVDSRYVGIFVKDSK